MDDTRPALPARQIASCGDVSCELLVDPIPRPRPEPFTVAITPARQRVVLVDNRKPNSLVILQMTQRVLRERGVEVEEEIPRKPSAGRPMGDDMLARLAAMGGLVLAGVSD
jgi:hypothetical protein